MGPADTFRAALLGNARAALAAKVAEVPPGSHRGTAVDLYLSGCVRGGRPLGVRGVAWCAAFASWCAWCAWASLSGAEVGPAALAWTPGALAHKGTTGGLVVPGVVRPGPLVVLPPFGYRAAVSELVADARASGAWREVEAYEPLPGDLCVMGRGGEDPRRGGDGHVAVVEEASDVDARCIGGNEEHAVRQTLRSTRTIDVPEPVVGFVASGTGLG